MSFHHSPKIVTDGLVFYVNPSSKKCYNGPIGLTSIINDLTGKNRFGFSQVYFQSDNSLLMGYAGNGVRWYRDFANVAGKVTYMCSFYLPPASAFVFGIEYPFILSSFDGLDGFAVYFDASSMPNAYISMYVALNPYSVEVRSYPLAENNESNFGKIYTVAGTLDNGVLKFYVNGSLTDSTYNLGVATAITKSQIEIGYSDLSFSDTNALIKVYSSMIYNRALSDKEILQNYNALKGRYKI